MLSETKVSKGYQTVVPSKIRKARNIIPGDILEWTDTKNGILVHPRKKRTLEDITGLIKSEGDAVEAKKKVQMGLK
ncbi:MAG: AbrB/MazE/SpoVT family DNA-binding domain-containing protein [ANME-2 cluster archaeon]|nr:AbrB/MazE/SpoVT family DNA-binding domain-containing protein [ANME-2 cluster archaeon]MBC2707624.1 AbrB/MazE/SpoVT family DNA-binding domain-containing protein [ANME-2 cluster archaeon]MBC2748473.1 AbrB/MazE/SpoVT family DNA-binding domain-containing protein [ANME-2 cluster archaeon]MBC2761896.1 AbrB/MazE/SpoVT family DNA-binding domain-containing protein [ANME-2 cluster archaeon]